MAAGDASLSLSLFSIISHVMWNIDAKTSEEAVGPPLTFISRLSLVLSVSWSHTLCTFSLSLLRSLHTTHLHRIHHHHYKTEEKRTGKTRLGWNKSCCFLSSLERNVLFSLVRNSVVMILSCKGNRHSVTLKQDDQFCCSFLLSLDSDLDSWFNFHFYHTTNTVSSLPVSIPGYWWYLITHWQGKETPKKRQIGFTASLGTEITFTFFLFTVFTLQFLGQ
jgi:hypothetical protein